MACKGEDKLPGMTLRFECTGSRPIVVVKFQPEGMRNMPPGALGCGVGKFAEMAFMPGDVKGRSPTYVDVEWTVRTAESELEWKQLDDRADKYRSQDWFEAQRRYAAALPRHSVRLELGTVISPELVAKVRADPSSTQLKLTVHFKDGAARATAEAYKWR